MASGLKASLKVKLKSRCWFLGAILGPDSGQISTLESYSEYGLHLKGAPANTSCTWSQLGQRMHDQAAGSGSNMSDVSQTRWPPVLPGNFDFSPIVKAVVIHTWSKLSFPSRALWPRAGSQETSETQVFPKPASSGKA